MRKLFIALCLLVMASPGWGAPAHDTGGVSGVFTVGAPTQTFTINLPTTGVANKLITVVIGIPATARSVSSIVTATNSLSFTKISRHTANSIDAEVWALYPASLPGTTATVTIDSSQSIGLAYYSDRWTGTVASTTAVEACTFSDFASGGTTSPLTSSVTTLTDGALAVGDFFVNSTIGWTLGSPATGYQTNDQGGTASVLGCLLQQVYGSAVVSPPAAVTPGIAFTGTMAAGTCCGISIAPVAVAATGHSLLLMGVGT